MEVSPSSLIHCCCICTNVVQAKREKVAQWTITYARYTSPFCKTLKYGSTVSTTTLYLIMSEEEVNTSTIQWWVAMVNQTSDLVHTLTVLLGESLVTERPPRC